MKRAAYLFLLVLLINCEVPIEVDLKDNPERLVVEGLITNEPGPYTVKLSTTARYNLQTILFKVTGATVTIFSSDGYDEVLEEVDYAVYQTKPGGIRGEIGKSYRITVEWKGNTYQSEPEVLLPVPEIQKIDYEFQKRDPVSIEGHRVDVTFTDPENEKNFYRWDWEGVYVFYTELPPFPLDACCNKCWRYEYGNEIDVSDDRLTNGQERIETVTVVPFFSPQDYLITVKQYSLTADAYRFWEQARQQIENIGGLFDPPPTLIKGNIFNSNNPDEIVLGFFGASAVSEIYVQIDRSYLDGVPPYKRIYPFGDCRQVGNTTIVKPEKWKD